MMYYEDSKYRIQADMALRIGKIAVQYSQLHLPPKENFKDTLHLCLLQNLLTYCQTLLDALGQAGEPEFELHVPLSEKSGWGLHEAEIEEDSFEGALTVATFLSHLRNAMSHPTGPNPKARFPSTGYYGIPDDEKLPMTMQKVIAIGFCNSPDTQNNRPRTWSQVNDAKDYAKNISSAIQIRPVPRNGFGMFYENEPYARVFHVILTNDQLHNLVPKLANLLAQPADDHWNGKSVENMLRAS